MITALIMSVILYLAITALRFALTFSALDHALTFNHDIQPEGSDHAD